MSISIRQCLRVYVPRAFHPKCRPYILVSETAPYLWAECLYISFCHALHSLTCKPRCSWSVLWICIWRLGSFASFEPCTWFLSHTGMIRGETHAIVQLFFVPINLTPPPTLAVCLFSKCILVFLLYWNHWCLFAVSVFLVKRLWIIDSMEAPCLSLVQCISLNVFFF